MEKKKLFVKPIHSALTQNLKLCEKCIVHEKIILACTLLFVNLILEQRFVF